MARMVFFAVLTACTLFISPDALAQQGMPPAGVKNFGSMMAMTYPPMGGSCPTPGYLIENREEIGLSDAQLTDLRKLDFELKRKKIMKGAEVKALELELTEIVTDPSFSLDKALAKLTEIEKARVELRTEVIKAAAKARDFLDAGQKEELRNLLMQLPLSGRIGPGARPAPRTNDDKEALKERMMREMMQQKMP